MQYSTLPELYAEQYGEPCTWISSKNVCRNPQIHELVWGANPYVLGVTEEPPNAGALGVGGYTELGCGHIRSIEIQHGLPPTNDYPKVYWPKVVDSEMASKFKGKTIVDPTGSRSNPQITNPNIPARMTDYVRHLVDVGDDVVVVQHAREFPTIPIQWEQVFGSRDFRPGHPDWGVPSKMARYRQSVQVSTIEIADIFEYLHALYHCKEYVGIQSGGASLATAAWRENPTLQITIFACAWYKKTDPFFYPGVNFQMV